MKCLILTNLLLNFYYIYIAILIYLEYIFNFKNHSSIFLQDFKFQKSCHAYHAS